VAQGEVTLSTDEITGVQALSCKHPDLPMQPGHVLRREFEYERHATLSFIVNFDVASGRVGQISSGSTRNEADFLAHIRATIDAQTPRRAMAFRCG
jgi:DDE superfamily endonuclease